MGVRARRAPQDYEEELSDEAQCTIVYSRVPLHRKSALARMAYSQDPDGRHGSAPVAASLYKDTGQSFKEVDSVLKAHPHVPPELRLRLMEIAREQAEAFERQSSTVHEDVYSTAQAGPHAAADPLPTGEAHPTPTEGEHAAPAAVPTQLPRHHTLHGSIRYVYNMWHQGIEKLVRNDVRYGWSQLPILLPFVRLFCTPCYLRACSCVTLVLALETEHCSR